VDNVLENLDPVKIDSFTEVLSKLTADKGELADAIVALGTSASSALGEERDARIAADDSLRSDLDSEISRAQGAEDQIASDLSTLTDSIPGRVRDVVLTGISFAANAAISAGDSVLAAFGKLQAQVTAAFSAIDTEVSDRQSEVSRLDGRVDTEISDRQGEISRVDGRIDTEISDRQSDVQSVRDSLGTIAGQNANNVNITGGTITGVTLNAQSMEVGQGQTADLFVGNDGKVGIGTETPTEKLTVNGNIDMLGGEIKNPSKIATPGELVVETNGGVLKLSSAQILSEEFGHSFLSFEETRLESYGSEKFNWNFVETAGEGGDELNIVRVRELNTKQIKLVVSDTAPEHIDGREWLDTTDFRRYISITGSWVESITA
jgi:hypothetical protein